MKKILITLLSLGLVSSAWADKLPVLASFSILADITREVGGERVTVQSLVGPDQDAHVFQPSPADVKKLAASKVLIINGLGFEGWMTRLSKSAQFKGVQVVASNKVKALKIEGDDDHGHQHSTQLDPHAWHNPLQVKIYINNIAAGLVKADPAGQAYYIQRAKEYTQKVSELDRWAAQAFAAVPVAKRKILTSHDAFAYLGARYQLKVLSAQGVSTDAEASAKGVAKLVRQVKKEQVRAVFMENMSDKRLLEQLSKEAKVTIAGKLYADALSAPKGPAKTYLEMFRYNVNTILKTLN